MESLSTEEQQWCAAMTRPGVQRSEGEILGALHGRSTPEDRQARRNQA
jgi:hypothetical protein